MTLATKPRWPDKDWHFRVYVYSPNAESCPICDTAGYRIIEQWSERPDRERPGWSFTRQTMMPCHCIVVSSKGLGGCGERTEKPYPEDRDPIGGPLPIDVDWSHRDN